MISNVFNRAVSRQIEWDDDGRLMIRKIGNNDNPVMTSSQTKIVEDHFTICPAVRTGQH